MRNLFIFIIVLLPFNGICQELALVRDTINKYEVGVPIGWRYGVPADNSVELVALRQKSSDSDLSRENFNINIVNRDNSDLNQTFSVFKTSIGQAKDFKILEEGELIINQVPYKWLIETHKNTISGEEMMDYVFIANKEGKILILTMVTISKNFADYKPLFHKVALSLKY